MSSIVHKVKDALSGDKHSTPEGTHGHHNTRAANAADPRIDSDRDHRAAPGHSTMGENTFSSNTTAGPHSSNMANKVDPRVDSDRDGSRTLGNNSGMTDSHGFTEGTHHTTGMTGTHGTSGMTGSYGHTEGSQGPHNSKIANTMDPRVDSDRDGSRTLGNNSGTYGTTGMTGTHGTSGMTGTHGTSGMTGSYGHTEGSHGPHDSKIANTMDPRVDSDRDGSRTLGNNSGMTGTHGTHHEHNTMGRVGATIGGTHGTGPAPNTAGPHSSDMANKIDPRVDSDLDGSKTMGRDKTYSQSSTTHKDPTDAAQVPPSVLKKTLGDPVVAHDDHTHDRERRHSVTTHQERFSGV